MPQTTWKKPTDNAQGISSNLVTIENKINSDNYYVAPYLKEELSEIVSTWGALESFGTKHGYREIIFTGPTGTGKTDGAKYLAWLLGYDIIDGNRILESNNIHGDFEKLREDTKEKPKILLIDEVEALSSREHIDNTKKERITQFLVELQANNNNLLVVGTTNYEGELDVALRGGGRFEKTVEFKAPDLEGRIKILNIHCFQSDHKFKFSKQDIPKIAEEINGYTGGDIFKLVNIGLANGIKRFIGYSESENDLIKLKDMLEEFQKKQAKKPVAVPINLDDLLKAKSKVIPTVLLDIPVEVPKQKLKDFIGYDDYSYYIKAVIEEKLKEGKGTSILIYGPKGTGKSYISKCVAGELNLNYIHVAGSEIEEGIVGSTKNKMKKYFTRARYAQPSMLMFDEFKGAVRQAHTWSHKEDQTSYFQSVLSDTIPGVIIMATINDIDALPGPVLDRFKYKIFIGPPSIEDSVKIWEFYLPEPLKKFASEIANVNPAITPRGVEDIVDSLKVLNITNIKAYTFMAQDYKSPDPEEINYTSLLEKFGCHVRKFQQIRQAGYI